jgi:hypothetical protein
MTNRTPALAALAICSVCLLGAGPPRGAGTVTKIEMMTRPKAFSGKCPANLRFTGVIHVSGQPVTVEYQWERSDGAKGPKKKIVIRNAGVGVNETWQLGGAGEHLTVSEKLHVLSPNEMVSSPGTVNVVCRS